MTDLSDKDICDRLRPLFLKRPEVQFAFLFGSYAKGCANRFSDVDIGIQIDLTIIGKPSAYGYKADFIADLMQHLKTNHVDLVILNDAPIFLKFQVLYHGQLIFCRDKASRIAFQVDTINLYQDFKHLRIPHQQAFARKYSHMKRDA
jgi:predicted nucleotidyltransferase